MNQVLIGKKAPAISAQAIVGGKIVEKFSLADYAGKYVMLFFYPLDFTFVCPTELHAFQEKEAEFAKLGAQLVGCSVDSPFSHDAWLQVPKAKGGIAGVRYPIIADLNKTVARSYQVLNEEVGIAYRGQFLIDRQGIIRHQLINDLAIGRSVDEALRVLCALIHSETYGEVCPANWVQGEKAMHPDHQGVVDHFQGLVK